MKMKKCLKSHYGILNQEQFNLFVEDLNKSLPRKYVEYLNSCNGGKVSPDCFNINKEEGATRISAFYGLHDGPEFNRLDSVNSVFKNRIPDDCIAIACDTTGNQICMCLEGEKRGAIYFWNHELEGYESGFIELVGSLDDFWDLLYEFELNKDEVSEVLLSKDESQWKKLISSYDVEALDENGRSLIERAVIKNNLIGVKLLVASGAKLNNSIALARKNKRFFPEFEDMCRFLENLVDK